MERLFAPLTERSFVREYYERAIAHVSRENPRHFHDIYNRRDLERGISFASQFAEHLIVLAGANKSAHPIDALRREQREPASFIYPNESQKCRIDVRRLADAFRDGCTIILNKADTLSPRLGGFTSTLAGELGFPIKANAYFTPPRAQGFKVHHDTHDTVILQIEGAKRWLIYEPQRTLPLRNEANLPDSYDRLASELSLTAGDTLYLPRGTPHCAETSDQPSLHLTLGWFQPHVSDVIIRVIEAVARNNVALRRGLRPRWIHDQSLKDAIRTTVSSMFGSFTALEQIAEVLDEMENEALRAASDVRGDYFSAIGDLGNLGDSVSLRLKEDIRLKVRDRLTTLELTVPGATHLLPARYANSLKRLLAGPAQIIELTDLSPTERMALAIKLISIGIATVIAR
jgi:lysine-specific demethylase/histidyl-hydroxylase NO66